MRVVGLALSEKMACVVKENGVLEFYSLPYLCLLRRIDVGADDVQTAAFEGNDLLLGSLSRGLTRINCTDYSVKRSREGGLWRLSVERGRLLAIYSLEEGGSELRIDGQIVYRAGSAIFAACLGSTPEEVVAGDERGRVLAIRQGGVVFELALSEFLGDRHQSGYNYGRRSQSSRFRQPAGAAPAAPAVVPTCLVRVVGHEYAVCTQSGEIFIVDCEAQLVKQTIKARENSLNCVCVIDHKIYVTGADSRVLCYAKTGSGEYAKYLQHSTHISDVWCMGVSGENLVTGGEDGVINVHQISALGNLANVRRYPSEEAAHSGDKLFLAAGTTISIAQVLAQPAARRPGHGPNQIAGYRTIFKHMTQHPVLSVQCWSNLAAVRTRDGVKVYRYHWSTSGVELLKVIKGTVLYHTIIGQTLWYLHARPKGLFLSKIALDLTQPQSWSFKEIGLEFVPAAISPGRPGEVVLSGERAGVFSAATGVFSELAVAQSVQSAVYNGQELFLCTKDPGSKITSEMALLRYSFADNTVTVAQEFDLNIAVATIATPTQVIVASQKKLAVLDTTAGTVKYFGVGATLDGVFLDSAADSPEIWGVQGPWTLTKQTLAPYTIKEKYGRQ